MQVLNVDFERLVKDARSIRRVIGCVMFLLRFLPEVLQLWMEIWI